MITLAAACSDATTWPDAIIMLGVLALIGFTFWIMWKTVK
jgi:hypothetical protein